MILFNRSCYSGKEKQYIDDCIESGQIQGDGKYTKLCHQWFREELKVGDNLLTTSCSTSLDMAAFLLNIEPGDEVIMPSYTFVSTANSFVARGAKVKFVDIRPDTMNMDEKLIEAALTDKTKAIIPVHYAGVSCEMDAINEIAKEKDLFVVEDAAQGVMSFYKNRPLGSLGDIGCYSFHGTKNYTSAGEGGLVIFKSHELFNRAEIIREKGTNRSQFSRGLIDKYTWVDQGSSLLPSDISAAFLYAQLENAKEINERRVFIWTRYYNALKDFMNKGVIELAKVPDHCDHNGHLFFMLLKSQKIRDEFIQFMKEANIVTPFHYVPLHSSPAGQKFSEFVGEDKYTTDCSSRLVRLPLYFNLEDKEIDYIIEKTTKYLSSL